MNWAVFKNTESIKLNKVPDLSIEQLKESIIEQCSFDNEMPKRPVLFFCYRDRNSKIKLVSVLADDEDSNLLIACADTTEKKLFMSITPEIPSMHIMEREIYEDFGIHPVGHPWLKPVRFSHNRFDSKHTIKNYPFFNFEGEEVHEVGVGPVHAGVIEPGHFRFMCVGEKVNHLEVQLGYQHRDIETLFLEGNPLKKNFLAESIAGDALIGHTWAYSQAVESLCGIIPAKSAEIIRAIGLEMERVAMHLADLSALSNDIAYLVGSSVYGATRTLVINALLSVCGSRFGKSLVCCGGVNHGISKSQKDELKKILKKVLRDTCRMSDTMFSTPTVLSRMEQTGIVSEDVAFAIGLLGMPARASGVAIDARVDQPFGVFRELPVNKNFLETGDVYARALIRYLEIKDSINFIFELLDSSVDLDTDLKKECIKIEPESITVSLVEGWRGEIAHAIISDCNGSILKYKVKDPSLQNWYGLALAVRHNGISDFPLCNKSFNLSYCGSDL